MEGKSKAFISVLTYCQSVQFQQSTLLLFKCVNDPQNERSVFLLKLEK